MLVLLVLATFDIASDAVSVPGWLYLALAVTGVVWIIVQAALGD